MSDAERPYDVALVGYGPVGATLANLLGQAGLSVCVIEKEPAIYPLPRAAHFDGAVMRIFQSAGLRDAVEAVTRPGLKGMHFVNPEGATLMIRAGGPNPGPQGCASSYYFHQPDLEAVLRARVSQFPAVTVLLQHEVVSIDMAPSEARLTLRDGASGRTLRIAARYVVGCDGARSLVRRTIGSPKEDLGLHQPWLVLDVVLKRPVDLSDHTVQICDPTRPMTYVNMVGPRRRWEIMLMPGDDPALITTPQSVWRLLRPWLTPDDADLERTTVYTFHSVIADGWRQGPLLLAGDAAHQSPPFLGQGMCAGIRDAANLAWKLAMVVEGRAPDALLDTYETERKPHVRAFIELAVRLGGFIQTTDPAIAAERDRRLTATDPEVFTFPEPQLGTGVHDEAVPGGTLFPQPRLDDGRLLDEAIGPRFAVLGDPAVVVGASSTTEARLRRAGAVVVHGTSEGVNAWLREHGARAVVLRPDRYVLGAVADAAGLDRLGAALPLV